MSVYKVFNVNKVCHRFYKTFHFTLNLSEQKDCKEILHSTVIGYDLFICLYAVFMPILRPFHWLWVSGLKLKFSEVYIIHYGQHAQMPNGFVFIAQDTFFGQDEKVLTIRYWFTVMKYTVTKMYINVLKNVIHYKLTHSKNVKW